MKKNINFNYKYQTDLSLRSSLIASSGFDGVFIYSQYHPENYIDDIVVSGLNIETLHLPYKRFENGECIDSQYVNVIWEDCDEWKSYLDLMLDEIAFAEKYKIKKAVMHITGGQNPPVMSPKGILFISKLLEACEQRDVTLCLENLRRLDYLDYVFSNIKSRKLGFCLDTGHANYMTKNLHSFPWERFGKYLKCLHLNDNFGSKDTHSIPFNGNINWSEIANKIIEYNPEIELTLEVRASEKDLMSVSEREYLFSAYSSLVQIEKLIERL